MRFALLTALCLLLGCAQPLVQPEELEAPTSGDEVDTADVEALHVPVAATALVRVRAGAIRRRGSAFLFYVKGDVGYLATASHVTHAPGTLRADILVRFSGSERDLVATAVNEDVDADIAVLRVRAAGLPTPLTRVRRGVNEPLLERLFLLGYPKVEGFRLSVRRAEFPMLPPMRRWTSGELVDPTEEDVITVDGRALPGDSGGPVVDASGALIGVISSIESDPRFYVPKALRDIPTPQPMLAQVVPARKLAALLRGRVHRITLTRVAGNPKTLDVRAEIFDPFGSCRGVSLLLVPRARTRPVTDRQLRPDPLIVELRVAGTVATGRVSLPPALAAGDGLRYQCAFQDGDNVRYTASRVLFLIRR